MQRRIPSNRKTGKGRSVKASKGTTPPRRYGSGEERYEGLMAGEAAVDYGAGGYFKVTVGENQRRYPVHSGYGYFIPSFRKAKNLMQVAQSVEKGIPSKEIGAITQYLDFKVPEIAKASAVSPSTVSRWKPETSIGVPGSSQFFKIDEVIRKGVHLFGGEKEFKFWLNNPNLALGNAVPAKLLVSLIGIDLVDEALDALHYGNVL